MAYRRGTSVPYIVVCVALIGLFVYMYFLKQDTTDAFEKRAPGDARVVDRHTVNSSLNSGRNGTVPKRSPAKKIEENKTDTRTGGSIARSGIEKHAINMDSMTPEELYNRMAIVTAISQNHLQESKGMIGSVQEILPHKKIIMFDLGLTPKGVKEVKRLCNVELRSFDFTKHPPHVKDLYTYAWKPLIIRDMLDEFGVVFWCDSSARLRKNPLVLFPILKEHKGFMAIVEQYKSTNMLVRTHPKMFEELGIDKEKFTKDDGYAMCMEGNRLLFVNTDLVQRKIMAPWLDCALRRDCIAPAGSALPVNLKGPVRFTHRFDQAALALIVYKNLRGVMYKGNDQSKLFFDVVGLTRSAKGSEKAKFCK